MGREPGPTNRLQVANALTNFISEELVPGSGVNERDFWSSFETLLVRLQPRAEQLLARRNELQTLIDNWHVEHSAAPHDPESYKDFLRSIGYLLEQPTNFTVSTQNVDVEIAAVAGPQLVVPVDNSRYALNAANARWGSLYDALYGTDVIPESNGANRTGDYNPIRGSKVIAFTREILDQCVPLVSGSHTGAISYTIDDQNLTVTTKSQKTRLANPEQFIGYTGPPECPLSILLQQHGLHIEITIDPTHTIGADDPAHIADVRLESAITTIMDFEDSVSTVDAHDKVLAYRNWLGLMKGTLSSTFTKGDRQVQRALASDTSYLDRHGQAQNLRRRSVMLVRNVGLHLMTDIVKLDGQPTAETILDAAITAWAAKHDVIGSSRHTNSASKSIYIVKPKMHGPEEVAFASELFVAIEELLGLNHGVLKMGIMDEERRTSLNLAACISEASQRVVFINTGFLDRTGDEIHTSMEAGPFVPKSKMKSQEWLSAYEDANVDIGLASGLPGHGQIGKGMWARPDDMAAMLKEKIGHPLSGASTAWVPSPTAATLHALHYLDVDVGERQVELQHRSPSRSEGMLTIPTLEPGNFFCSDEVERDLENNVQGILGYVSRWVGQGIGCSKVPDITDVGLMEDRATLRISSQHIVNWLHHGIVTADQVTKTMTEMARVVDKQNAGDPSYHPMAADPANSIPFQAAMALIFEGREQANGYTEFILTEYRRRMKVYLSS